MTRIVYNRILKGWYVVRGLHDTPISTRFDSRADAQAWLDKRRQGDDWRPPTVAERRAQLRRQGRRTR